MAKIKQPFMSVSARGTLGGVLTAFQHQARSYMLSKNQRRGLFVSPLAGFGRIYFGSSFFGFLGRYSKNTKSQKQGAQRAIFQNAWKAYALLSPTEKNVLKNEAKNLKMTGPNLFMSRYFGR